MTRPRSLRTNLSLLSTLPSGQRHRRCRYILLRGRLPTRLERQGMSVSRANASSGLDRAALSAYDQADSHIETPLQELQESSSPEESNNTAEGRDDTSSGPLSFAKVRRVSKKVRSKTKAKTSKILHTSTKQETFSGPITAPALAPTPSSKADTDRLFHSAPEHKGPQVKDLLHHPVDTVQSVLHGASGAKVAEVMDNQVIAHGADVNLVRAHDQVASAANEEDERLALEDLEELKKARQDTYVRWTMDRHVLKVRRIPPHNLSRPHKKDYEMVDERGKGQVQWATYGQAVRHPRSPQRTTPPLALMRVQSTGPAQILNQNPACSFLCQKVW